MLNIEKWINAQNIEIKQITLYNTFLCPAVYYVKQNTDTLAFNTCTCILYLFSSFRCQHAGVISCYAQCLMFNVQCSIMSWAWQFHTYNTVYGH
jgi:hypothetical protein